MIESREEASSVATVLPACSRATCGRPFGAQVKYCPFCGQQQPAPEAVKRTEQVVLGPGRPGERDRAAAVGSHLAVTAPVEAVPEDPAVAGASEVKPDKPGPPAAFRRWRAIAALIAAVAGLIMVVWIVSGSSPEGTVTVTAILPNGSVETSGKVLADGQPIGPPGVAIPRPAGPAAIGYAAQGWSADEQRTTIAANANSAVRLHLRPIPARVSVVTAPPGANLSIDGKAYGRTPIDVTLSDGRHELAVSLNGYVPKSSTFYFERGEERRIDLDLAAVAPPQDYRATPPAPVPPEPSPSAASAYLCGKPTPYRSVASYGQQSLVGIWSGDWSSRICGGLIVERIGFDGRADIVYVYATSSKSGEYRLQAETEGNVLQFADPEGGRFAFMLEGGNLTAHFMSLKGLELDTVFTRQ
jgi:hypothetical protein